MSAHRFPILLLRDAAGFHTAALVDGNVSAFAQTAADARAQLKDHLERLYRASPWQPAPDFEDPELLTLKVDVRPKYEHEGRVHPVGETIALRCPVVTGQTSAGLRVAAVPLLGLRFSFYAPEELRPLVTQYV